MADKKRMYRAELRLNALEKKSSGSIKNSDAFKLTKDVAELKTDIDVIFCLIDELEDRILELEVLNDHQGGHSGKRKNTKPNWRQDSGVCSKCCGHVMP